jgi:O-antigen/teichoic acid export membrane protein
MAWTLMGALGTNLIRIGSLAVLSRLLTPEDFGIVAAAMAVMVLVHSVRDLGIGVALIQRRDLEPTHVETAFTFSVLLGLGLAGLMFLLAPLIGWAFGIPRSIPVLRAMSVMFALRGLSTVSFTLSQREFRFRALATIDVVGYAAGTAVAIALAAGGAGPWAIVAGYLVETALGVTLLVSIRPPPWLLRIHRRELRELLGFGAHNTLGRLASIAATQGDNVVVGHALGGPQLGYYSRAYDLMSFPSNVFTTVAGSVLFPTFATIQDDPDALATAYSRALFATAVLLLPASAGLVILAPEAIRLVMGNQWSSAVIPFQIMAASMLFRTSYKVGAIVARAAGDVLGVAITQAIYASLVIGGAIVAARWGIAGVATTTAVAVTLNFVMLTQLGMRRTSLTWAGVARAHAQGLIATGLTVGAAWPVAALLRSAHAPLVVIVTATILAGAAGPAVMAWTGIRRAGTDWAWIWSTLRQGLGGRRAKREPTAAPPS